MTLWQGPRPGLPIGAFAVATDQGEVAAFAAALGLADPAEVPLTFPMRWLASPEVRGAILCALGPEGPAGGVLVHLEQRIRVLEPLQRDESHELQVSIEPGKTSGRMSVHAEVFREGRLVCQLSGRFALLGAHGEGSE